MWACISPLNPSRHISSQHLDSTFRNAVTSPLLALPAEIRDRIFGFVVGHESIHVSLDPPDNNHYYSREERKYRLNLCPEPEPLPNPSTSRAQLMAGDDEDPPFVKRHIRCCIKQTRQPVNEAISLNLLLTCRQIYKEASLLPFTRNKFIVEFGLGREEVFPPGVNVLEAFIGTLAPEQRNSIKHLTLASSEFNASDSQQIERLRGLAILQIVHTHLSGHKDSDYWPNDETFTWGSWSRALSMALLRDVRHTAELEEEDCESCTGSCWDEDQICGIDQTLRGWEARLLERARESRRVVGGEKKRKVLKKRDSFYWQDVDEEDEDGEEEEDEDEDEGYDDEWDDCDGSCKGLAGCAGIEELKRLGLVRLHLPRDGARARDVMMFVMNGRVRGGL